MHGVARNAKIIGETLAARKQDARRPFFWYSVCTMKTRDPEQESGPAEEMQAPQGEVTRRLNRAFGPIVAGLIIDVVDFATFGPIGYLLGLPVGGFAGYWMGRCLGFSRRTSFYCAIAAGIYCTIPGTELIPLATLLGAYVRFRESGREEAPDSLGETEDRRL